jgi:hypothetical protein
MTEPHNTITAPGVSATVRGEERVSESQTGVTVSAMVELDKVEHLLSDKPLRRPNRTRPLERPKRKKARRK